MGIKVTNSTYRNGRELVTNKTQKIRRRNKSILWKIVTWNIRGFKEKELELIESLKEAEYRVVITDLS